MLRPEVEEIVAKGWPEVKKEEREQFVKALIEKREAVKKALTEMRGNAEDIETIVLLENCLKEGHYDD